MVPPELSDEEYLVSRAREELKRDAYAARAWMLTAKSLFSQNFNIQFEAYNIEKQTRHVKEAARCFSTIFQKFEHEPQLWQEVRALTDSSDPDATFFKEMFSHIPSGQYNLYNIIAVCEVQQRVLIATAERSEDTLEQCRLLLLLLRQFPSTAPVHATRLVELLLSVERHIAGSFNVYRHFLVCKVLPLLGQNTGVQLSPKLLFRLLHKAIDFYITLTLSPTKTWPEDEEGVGDPWQGLFTVQEQLGHKLGWTLSNPSPLAGSKDSFWQRLRHFAQTRQLEGPIATQDVKELVYCGMTFLLLCLHEYASALDGTLGNDSNGGSSISGNAQQDPQLMLVEAFIGGDKDDGAPPPAKRVRLAEDDQCPVLTVSAHASAVARQSLVKTFLLAIRTWDLLHSTESTKREFLRLQQQLRLSEGPWLRVFLEDENLFRGRASMLANTEAPMSLPRSLRLASTALCLGRYVEASQHAMDAVACIPSTPVGQLSGSLRRSTSNGRHLHYLTLSRLEVLQYCTKLLLTCLQRVLRGQSGEVALGHCLVLLQLDWPQEQELASLLLEQVKAAGRFCYPPFSRYVVNTDILEELAYLSSEQGGRVILDILPSVSSQLPSRRMATRGGDKGAKEDFKQAMRRQVARSSESVESLVRQFLSGERSAVLQAISS